VDAAGGGAGVVYWVGGAGCLIGRSVAASGDTITSDLSGADKGLLGSGCAVEQMRPPPHAFFWEL
jgi:hypothetical protein